MNFSVKLFVWPVLKYNQRIPLFQVKWVFLSYLYIELIQLQTILLKTMNSASLSFSLCKPEATLILLQTSFAQGEFFLLIKDKKPFYISWSACGGDNCGSFITVQLPKDLCSYPKIWAITPWEFAGSLVNAWVNPLLCISRCTKSTKKTPKLPVLPELFSMQRKRFQMWKELCFSRSVTEEVESPCPGCHRCLEEPRSRGQPTPAPAAASCRTEALVHATLSRESSAPGRLQAMSTGSGLDSITLLGGAHSTCFAEPLSIIITSPFCYSDD